MNQSSFAVYEYELGLSFASYSTFFKILTYVYRITTRVVIIDLGNGHMKLLYEGLITSEVLLSPIPFLKLRDKQFEFY
jgi:hypothetical protein